MQDETRIELIGHISIRDPDTGEIIVRQRDNNEKATHENHA